MPSAAPWTSCATLASQSMSRKLYARNPECMYVGAPPRCLHGRFSNAAVPTSNETAAVDCCRKLVGGGMLSRGDPDLYAS